MIVKINEKSQEVMKGILELLPVRASKSAIIEAALDEMLANLKEKETKDETR